MEEITAEERQELATFSQIATSLDGDESSANVGPTEDPLGFTPDDIAELQQKIDDAGQDFITSREDLEVEETAWNTEDSLAAAQKFFSSAAVGWGDEAGLWVSAFLNSQVVDRFVAPELNSTVTKEYKRLKKRYDEEQAVFAERQPGAAIAADIGGALASPATYVAAPAAVTARLAQLAGRSGTVARAGAFGGRVAAEGGVYGAGEAKEGERLEGLQTGAAYSVVGAGVVKGVTKGLGAVTDVATRRRIEGNLIDADGDFVPLTLAATSPKGSEGLVHTLYRDIIAPSFGAKGVIKEQEEVIISKTENMLKEQTVWAKQLDDGVKLKEIEISNQLKEAEKVLVDEGKVLKAIKETETTTKVAPINEKLKALNSGKAEEIVNKSLADTRQVLDAQRFNFSNETFLSSLPAGHTNIDRKNILAITDIGNRAAALDSLWQNKGYGMLKNRTFRFKSGELQKELETALNDDVYFLANAMDMKAVMTTFNKAIDNVDFFKDSNGRVSGELVSALRSRIGTIANATVEPQQKRAIYAVQDQIDTIVKKQLTKADEKAFSQESGKWKATVVLREAVAKAMLDRKKRGAFDETDWIASVGKNNRWDARYGTGPLSRRARALESTLDATEKTMAKRATNLAKAKARATEKEIQQHNQKLKNALESIEKDITLNKSRLPANPELAAEIARDMTKRNSLGSEIEELDTTLKTLQSLRSPSNPGWFHTMAATGVLVAGFKGAGLSFQDSVTAGTAVALGGARALATPTAQKIVAGQSTGQEAIQRMLNSDVTGKTSDILGRLGGAVNARAGGMLTE